MLAPHSTCKLGGLMVRLAKRSRVCFSKLPVGNHVITELSCAFALCAASDEATEIRDDVALLTHPPPLGGFALRAAFRLSVSPPASWLGSKPSRPR